MSRVLIMAGGTGGHVMPGLAVAELLQARGMDISWLGTAQGIESTLVPAKGIALEVINSRGLRGKGFGHGLTAPFMLLKSLFQAIRVLRRLRPAVVLGMGGYAAGPGGLAAWLLRYPLVLHEQNSVVGLTNRLLRPLARTTLYGFPGVAVNTGGDQRFVGNPVLAGHGANESVTKSVTDKLAPELVARCSASAEKPVLKILVLGGSQGARAINTVVAEFATTAIARESCAIWHQCGDRLLEETQLLVGDIGLKSSYQLNGFIDGMAAAYDWADIVIARAGALTISELCSAAKPSILIPLPSAAGDHQTTNARLLVNHQAALLLPQRKLDVASLQLAIEELTNADKRRLMARAASDLAKPDAAQSVAAVCLEYCDA